MIAKKTACQQTPPEAELPCATHCTEDKADVAKDSPNAARRGTCNEVYAQLGMRACSVRTAG